MCKANPYRGMILSARKNCFLCLILLASVGIKTMLYFIDLWLMLDNTQEIVWPVCTQNKDNTFPENMEFLWGRKGEKEVSAKDS